MYPDNDLHSKKHGQKALFKHGSSSAGSTVLLNTIVRPTCILPVGSIVRNTRYPQSVLFTILMTLQVRLVLDFILQGTVDLGPRTILCYAARCCTALEHTHLSNAVIQPHRLFMLRLIYVWRHTSTLNDALYREQHSFGSREALHYRVASIWDLMIPLGIHLGFDYPSGVPIGDMDVHLGNVDVNLGYPYPRRMSMSQMNINISDGCRYPGDMFTSHVDMIPEEYTHP